MNIDNGKEKLLRINIPPKNQEALREDMFSQPICKPTMDSSQGGFPGEIIPRGGDVSLESPGEEVIWAETRRDAGTSASSVSATVRKGGDSDDTGGVIGKFFWQDN